MTAVATTCPYCGVGCGVLVEASLQAVRGDPDHPANFGRLCSKGAALNETLEMQGRLTHPEVDGRRTDWDTALDSVARGLRRSIQQYGPDSVAFYVSGQLLTEDYYVANKLMKGFLGSGNIDTNSRLCMASSVAGYKRALGADFVPNSYEDLEQAELLVMVGSNMAWCHPVLYQRVMQAKARNARVRIVVIDPRRTATCDAADLFLQIRPGTDVILFNGLLNYLRQEDALEWGYLDAHTEGFAVALRAAKQSAASVPDVAAACGLAAVDVADFYAWFAATTKTVTLFSQGVNQSVSGTDKVNSIINVHLATGRIGKAGMGPFSLTGQPNAMGGREVGGLANQLAAHMDFDAAAIDRVARFWQAPNLARGPGLKAVQMFDAMARGRIKAVWIMATNPAVSMPAAAEVTLALERCDLVVVSDCMRETDTTACADVLLPAASWGEKSGTVTNSERRISRQRSFMQAPGEARPDWWIITEVARRMGFAAAFDYASPAAIFREHARLSGFENAASRDFDISAFAELSDAEYEALQPFRWPAPAVARCSRHMFYTPSGKAQFVATAPRPPSEPASPNWPFILNTGRVRDHWHTMTRTGQTARLSGHTPEPFVQVNPRDAEHLELHDGQIAEIRSRLDQRMLARVVVTDAVQSGQLFVPMHWSQQFASQGRVGPLIRARTDPVSGQPELKLTAVSLQSYPAAWYGFILSRRRLNLPADGYVVRSKGINHWRYEIAGRAAPDSWSAWSRQFMRADGERLEFADPATGRYRSAVIDQGRLAACLFAAEDFALPAREWLGRNFTAEVLSDEARISVLAGRPVAGRVDAGSLICTCFSVGATTIVDAIQTQGLVSVQRIGEVLKAGTNCGSCLPELSALLRTVACRDAAGPEQGNELATQTNGA